MTIYHEMHKVIDDITDTLFAPDKRRIAGWIDRMIGKNEECLGKANIHCFIYNGEFYRQSNVRGHIQFRPALDYSLWDEMDQLLADKKQIEKDRAFVRQALVALLEPCGTIQEVRDALPDCVAETMPQLQGIERRASPMWSIVGNVRAQRQIDKIMPKLELYSIARMMF
jgi:hypothetical protein